MPREGRSPAPWMASARVACFERWARYTPLPNWFNNLAQGRIFKGFCPDEARMALSQYETRIARALADVLFAPSGSLPSPDEAGVVERVSAYLGSLPAEVQAQMRALLIGFDVGFGVVMRAPARRFVGASYEEQQEYVRRCESSYGHQRMSFDGLRLVFVVAYAESPTVTAALGIGSVPDPSPASITAEEAP